MKNFFLAFFLIFFLSGQLSLVANTKKERQLSRAQIDNEIAKLKKQKKFQDPKILDRLAYLYHLKKDFLEEIRALDLIRVDKKISPSQLVRLGNAYAAINKMDESVQAFRSAMKVAPKYEPAYRGLYDLFIKNSRQADARLVVMEVYERLGPQKQWLNEYCRIEYEQQYFEHAIEICEKAILKDPHRPDNHVYLALSLKATDKGVQARKILFKAAKQFKNSELVQLSAGEESEEINNWELAQQQYLQCIHANKHSGECYLRLGKIFFQLKKYPSALKALLKACPYEKDATINLRKFSYDLDKLNLHKEAKDFMSKVDKCDLIWYRQNKKSKK